MAKSTKDASPSPRRGDSRARIPRPAGPRNPARKEEALAALVRQTIKVQEEERRRVATEIHDGVTQQLVSIWFRVHACQRLLERGEVSSAREELARMKDVIDETLSETRNAIYNLRPATLDDLGLVPALHEFAGRFRDETGVECSVESLGDARLEPHVETALYRIAQEALANVRKHSGASHAGVMLRAGDTTATLTIADDGNGFDMISFERHRPLTSFGLAGMRERIELVGGRLAVRSRPGSGTQVKVTVPIPAQGDLR